MQIEPLQSNELMHFGVLGMKWGKRKDKYGGLSKQDYKDRKKLNKIFKRESKRVYRQHDPRAKNRIKVKSESSKAISGSKQVANTWSKAMKSYQSGDLDRYKKDLFKYKATVSNISHSYDKKYVDAFLKDVGMTKVSNINKQYVLDVYTGKKRPTK